MVADTTSVIVAPPGGASDPAWLEMRARLWPDGTPADHLREMEAALRRQFLVRMAWVDGAPVGFVETSKRTDYVNGTDSSPVAFVEGLYVEPGWRRRGVARALMDTAAEWARAQGFAEIASDSLAGNTSAHAVHRALGFEEMERVVYFRRALQPAVSK